MRPQAVNIPVDSLYASPGDIENKEKVARLLSRYLDLDYSFIIERIRRPKQFVWIARKLSPEVSEAIRRLKLKGLGFIKESMRSYPNGYIGGHILGFAGLDNVGLEGVELFYDKYLRGESGWVYILRDARQKQLSFQEKIVPPKDGFDIVLTIDEVIQFIAERELDEACRVHNARGGSIVVMGPFTGEILAFANRPKFDPNLVSDRKPDIMRNRAICDLFEPGSVFKIVTACAALEEKAFVENDRLFCENGAYRIANHILHDHRPHGNLTFREIFEQSSNIGVTKIAQKLGPEVIYKYAKLFGFGSSTGIDLPGEINGILKEPKHWSNTSIGAVPIGQEVAVTAIQLACAISVIANGGNLMRPYVIKRIQDRYNEVIKEYSPRVKRRVISKETALRMRRILQGVVGQGTGRRASSSEFTTAGKTGTAQKIEPDGRYSHRKFIASFIGFAPAENPRLAVAVVIDEPHPYYFGGVVSAPVFKNVVEDSLKYLGVPADKTQMVLNNRQ